MNRKLLLTVLLPACIAFQVAVQLSGAAAFGQSTFGDIRGVTRNRSGLPLPEVQVVLHSVEETTDRTVVSGSDGAFIAENLTPGHYQLTAKKEGVGSSPATTVALAAGQSLHNDITLASTNGSKASSEPSSPAVTGNSDRTSLTEREKQLLDRIDRLEQRLAAMEAKEAKEVTQASIPTQPTPMVRPDKGATQAAAPAMPVLVASLDGPAALPPTENPNVLSITPMPGTAAAKPAGASLAAVAVQTAGAETKPEKPAKAEPFAYADWTWLNGTARNKDVVFDSKFFTPEIRFDTHFVSSFNHPKDDTIGGSSEIFRSNEVQVEQISFGGDFHWQNVRGRVLTMFGMFAVTTPRNDASPGRGQWDLRGAYKYVSEAYGGYHFNVNHGLNLDAGIFVSYIGLFSYYNFDNWAYQPSYVSSNTPWFFNGVRVQWFPTDKLKIEPWFINGWQSYARFGTTPGLGGQILWRPKPWLSTVFNNYGMGEDTLGLIGRSRLHTDDSIEVKYYDRPKKTLDKMAFSFTGDLGCEYGGGVSCHGGKGGPKQAFLGWMAYNRFWFKKDLYGITLGGGQMSNPGRYLTLLPPINGADAISGSPYFPANPGSSFHAWDGTVTFDYMPKQYITFRAEYGYRHSDVPYWSGRGGITPPGGNNGSPQFYACSSGAASGTSDLGAAEAACGGGLGSVWFPDLRKNEASLRLAIMVKF
ncbi:MAG: outer membrane beta-barrel protein [Acidobacteriia bacterium]|nr:outer membrane beta-barrel protein [Terriglobia bacterium]